MTGLTTLLTGFRPLTTTGGTGPAEEDLLLRSHTPLIRTATEITSSSHRALTSRRCSHLSTHTRVLS